MPDGVPGMSGETLTGFAHGVAGIVFFLLEYGHRFADKTSIAAAERGLDWLIQQGIPSCDESESATQLHGLRWRYSDRHEAVWNWWCHGAPGIALTFIQAYRWTRCPRAGSVARRALAEIDPNFRGANLSTCHGLSGLGEILLEAARLLHDPLYREKALLLADTIVHLGHRCRDGAMLWLAEDPIAPTADLMVGMGGIAHFLARLSRRTTQLPFPLLP
jgi:lantibiotic modifying enzyme